MTAMHVAEPPEHQPQEPRMEGRSLPYPNNSRYIQGAERERYARIAAERYAAGASIQAIAAELGRSKSFVNGLLHRDTDVEVRPRSKPRLPVSDT